MPEQYPRISITRTHKEWKIVDKKIKELGKKDLSSYIKNQIPRIKEEFEKCPENLCFGGGEKKQRQEYLGIHHYEILSEISEKTGIEKGILVNRLIIEPLLINPT